MFLRLSLRTESKAVSKSIKCVYRLAFYSFGCSKMFFNIKICSVVLLFSLNPACSFRNFMSSPFYIRSSTSCRKFYKWWVAKSLLSSCCNHANHLSWISWQQVPSSAIPAIFQFPKARYNILSVYLRFIPCQRSVGLGLLHPLLPLSLAPSFLMHPFPLEFAIPLHVLPQSPPVLLFYVLQPDLLGHLYLKFHLSDLPFTLVLPYSSLFLPFSAVFSAAAALSFNQFLFSSLALLSLPYLTHYTPLSIAVLVVPISQPLFSVLLLSSPKFPPHFVSYPWFALLFRLALTFSAASLYVTKILLFSSSWYSISPYTTNLFFTSMLYLFLISSLRSLHASILTLAFFLLYALAPSGVTTLSWWGSLRVSMTLRAMQVESCALGRVTHSKQVEGEKPNKEWSPGPPGWGLGAGLTNLPRRKKTHVTETGCIEGN